MESALFDALKKLRENIPRLADHLKLGNDEQIRFWTDIVDAKLLTRLTPDFPVVAAICGGGSSGKSTLFNSLVGDHLTPTRAFFHSGGADRADRSINRTGTTFPIGSGSPERQGRTDGSGKTALCFKPIPHE